MPLQTWQQTLIAAQGDGTAHNTSTAESAAGVILPGQAKFTFPANFFDVIGKTIRITAGGRVSNIVTTPGTLTLRFKLGPTQNIAVASTGAMQLSAVAKTNVTWYLQWLLTLRAVGASTSANFMHTGQWASESTVGGGTGAAGQTVPIGVYQIPATAPAVGTGFDSTVANVADLTAQFSVSNANNSIQVHQFVIESLN